MAVVSRSRHESNTRIPCRVKGRRTDSVRKSRKIQQNGSGGGVLSNTPNEFGRLLKYTFVWNAANISRRTFCSRSAFSRSRGCHWQIGPPSTRPSVFSSFIYFIHLFLPFSRHVFRTFSAETPSSILFYRWWTAAAMNCSKSIYVYIYILDYIVHSNNQQTFERGYFPSGIVLQNPIYRKIVLPITRHLSRMNGQPRSRFE